MVLNVRLVNVNLKPIFDIAIPGGKSLRALFDTGSTKVIWCSTKNNITDFHFQDTHEATILSGFGTGEQTGCRIYKGSFGIYRGGRGIIFRDVEVVESTKKIAAFDMILPYALFHSFRYTFEPASPDAKFGKLVIDTLSDKITHRVKSYGGVVAEVYADEEAETGEYEEDRILAELMRKGDELMRDLQVWER